MIDLQLATNGIKYCLQILVVTLVTLSSADAHELYLGQIVVQHPWVLPAKAGESTRLYLAITNEGYSPVYFTGVKTPVANETAITFQSKPGVTRSLDFITVPSGETLNLGTSHMWIAVRNIKQDLTLGDKFPAALEFGQGRQVLVVVSVGRVH